MLYLIGIRDCGIDRTRMRQAIAEFYFMASMTGRYTSSPETWFEADLGQVRDLASGEVFVAKLREICDTTLTNDYWEITLPSQLATSAARSRALFAYQASLIMLDAPALSARSNLRPWLIRRSRDRKHRWSSITCSRVPISKPKASPI
ncbi:MAG: hypothetical protein R3E14_01025 [Erythrobacter sp.]